MIKCKYRAILLFLLLIIYLNEVGARRNRNTRRKEKCTKPDKMSNAGLKRRYERKEMFNDGDKVVYTCQPGYTMEGMTMQRWCRKGNWTDALFTCNQKCTKPDKVSNANLKKKYKRKRRFKDGDKVEYNCQPGYTMGGATRKRWCRKGNWTGVLFSCNSGHPYRQSTLNQDLKVYRDIAIDQILAGTNYKENVGDLEFELMELDIIVNKSVKTPSSSESFRANFIKEKRRRWGTEIHYNIGDEMSAVQENAIRKAIDVWPLYSCISFSENKQAYNRIEFKLSKNNVCASSDVGMRQGRQTIYLGETCFETEIIVHEIGHALGFYHEHNRWDRDDYIKIHNENIEPGREESFQKQKKTNFDYDYLSIMHYGQYFFSRNKSANLITIETKNDTFQSKIGKAKHPSFQDYKTLNAMYKCADRCANIQCPEGGFLGKNCQCYCKGNRNDTSVELCFQKGECPKRTVNEYLFEVKKKDKETPVSKNRTSFPDKTVLHIYSTNWNCKRVSRLRCENGEWKTKRRSITECPVTLNITLKEGVVKVRLNDYYDGYICDDDWGDNDAKVACKMLGYTNGLAYSLKPQEVNKSLPILLDNVQCSGNESSLAECKHNGWGIHNCGYSEVATVKCSNSSLPYHIDKTECGIITLGNSKRKKRQLKVSGGSETIKGMHPWQVGIQRKEKEWSHLCGGTIINDKWILSAAHCFDDFEKRKLDLKDLRVIVGVHDLTKHDEYEDIFYIEYIVKHWNYSEFNRNYAINDIVLLKIKSYIVFNDFKQPACLPESSDLSETKCEVSGWGKEKENGRITDTLRAAQVAIIQEHDCRLTLVKDYPIDFGKVICAGDDGADTCKGDSGGPLICEINGKSTIIGITSWGKGCGRKESPGVYTKVSKYLKWINNQISNHHFEEAITNDPCTESPCKNGGTCTSQSGSYTCTCTSQFAGTNCEQSCPGGWNLSSGRCYMFKQAEVDWNTAKRKCDDKGGTLVQIDSEAVNNYLYTLRSTEGNERVEAWIGLDDRETENIFKWDGSKQRATYTNWRTYEPNNGATNEDCVEMTATKKWNDNFCYNEKSYFCERSLTKSCPSGWNLSSGRCYIFKNEEVDWSTAKRKCAHEGGTLAQVDSEAVNNYLYTLRSDTGHETVEAWIGLRDAKTENIFKWDRSKQRATYTNWNTNEPNNGQGYTEEDCVKMTASKKWNDYACSSEISYFCERSPRELCPSGWSLLRGRCYIYKNEEVDWSTAKRNCALEGGTLAQIDRKAVNNFLNTLRRNTGHSTVRAWIGLGDAETENIFKWDGTKQRATYTNWETNEPNNGLGHAVENCVEMTATKKWNDIFCNSEKSYFCERSPTFAS